MQDKYDGLETIYERIKAAKDTIGLKSFIRSEDDTEIKEKSLPCVFMGTGNDAIIRYDSRKQHGYPAARIALVYLELVTNSKTETTVMFDKLRKAVLSDCLVSTTGFIREMKSTGIQNYNMPNIKAMTLVLGLHYMDAGI